MSVPLDTQLAPPEPLGDDLAQHWALDPSITFLNHGCFGARTRSVLAAQAEWRDCFERSPIEVLDRQRDELIRLRRERLGGFIGCAANDLGFVSNASAAVNAVLRSLPFKAGDELLTTSHVYNAVRRTLEYVVARQGVTYREVAIPFPLQESRQVVDRIAEALSPRTRLLIVDHVTSPTAVVFPVRELSELCREREIDLLVDGAHAPGMIDLDIQSLAPSWYAGNLHKWVCAPPGAGFLWARPDRQMGIHPPVISHFLNEGLAAEFNWQGTRDITPWLCVDDALTYFETFGWDRVRQHNHRLATWAQHLLCERWGVQPNTPLDGSMLGSMATVTLPSIPDRYEQPMDLQRELWNRWRIEVPIVDWNGRWWVRVSCQIYNRPEQYQHLADAVLEALH